MTMPTSGGVRQTRNRTSTRGKTDGTREAGARACPFHSEGLTTSNDLARFLAKVDHEGMDVPGMNLRCWQWTGSVDDKGRPRFNLGGRGILARRALIEVLAGTRLADGWAVGSLCHNRQCVRPDHLVVCNDVDHAALRVGGRLGPDMAPAIRRLFADGYTPEELAVNLGVSTRLVAAILREGAHIREGKSACGF